MIRHLLVFVIMAACGALVALAVRSAWHDPHAAPAGGHEHHAPAAPTPAPTPAPEKPAHQPHADHALGKPVNQICAICGMDADPKLTATYKDQIIAFGCAKCPEKFAKDPEHFGPYFLKNQEAP